jgi:hypothetical protein
MIDERGNFGFDGVASGWYEPELSFEDHALAVEDVFVGIEGGDAR